MLRTPRLAAPGGEARGGEPAAAESGNTATGKLSLETPGMTSTPVFSDITADGSHLFFMTDESLVADDTDGGRRDVAVPGSVSVDSAPLAYTTGDAPAAVDPQLGVNDPYDDVFGAKVLIASGAQPGDELSYNGTSGDTITIARRGTDGDYRDALRAVTFKATSPGKRVIELTVDNGSGPGPAAAREISVRAPSPPGDGSGGDTLPSRTRRSRTRVQCRRCCASRTAARGSPTSGVGASSAYRA